MESVALEVQVPGGPEQSDLPSDVSRATVWLLRLEPLHTQNTQQGGSSQPT